MQFRFGIAPQKLIFCGKTLQVILLHSSKVTILALSVENILLKCFFTILTMSDPLAYFTMLLCYMTSYFSNIKIK